MSFFSSFSWRDRALIFLILIALLGVLPFLILHRPKDRTIHTHGDHDVYFDIDTDIHGEETQQTNSLHGEDAIDKDESGCLDLRWSEWGPWSDCAITLSRECMKVRFRSCMCDPVTPRPARRCETNLGGEQIIVENCSISICIPPPESPKPKYLLEIPSYGPNNQYIGMKETMLIARDIRRTMILPNFLGHGDGTFRLFNTTFESNPLTAYVNITDMDTFVHECEGHIEVMVWMRWEAIHKGFVMYYLSRHNIKTVGQEVLVSPNLAREERAFRSHDEIKNFFAQYENVTCLAIACPFRNIWFGEEERQQLGKYVYHANYIHELAVKAISEMGVTSDDILSYHWRFGEDSCAIYTVPNMTFCWGTSVFCWAKIEDVIFVVTSIINQTRTLSKRSVFYLSISIKFNPKEMLAQLRDSLNPYNITIITSPEVPTLASITDNYILSLVEQEICALSKNFIASSFSTWSDYIVDWMVSTGRGDHVFIMNDLFEKYSKKFVQLVLPDLKKEG
eukprot:TRINITY_DN8617_c0_g1_i1.p1 TRINITY_DN8617_c0_g1~~TRINITY_DN8617_c0_g1_i1.p1  ORF type:complete len:507 (-),score=54.74 TRINITY_DN8617_c0_g1_i1:35-1555(-)